MAIQIFLNGKAITTEKTSVFALQRAEGINDPVIILNGFQIQEDRDLQDGDQVFFIQKGVLPPREQLEAMLSARHTPGIQQKIRMGRVAVAGLGGLGSHIAVSLARLGVGYLRLIDDDVVEPSNLNRQHYMIQHLGQYKTEALRAQLLEINPFITVDIHTVRVTEENAEGLFDGCTILCEAFDSPEEKAMLVNWAMCTRTHRPAYIVASSGMAGYGSGNEIQTTRKMSRFYLCGDYHTEAEEGIGLMAPRVQICAGHQANMVLRLLLNMEAP